MYKFLAIRLISSLVVMLAVSIGVFSLIHIAPGDPIEIMMSGSAANVDVEKMREQLGLTQPLPVQYFRYLYRVLHGDLGRSLIGRRLVADEFIDRFPNTAILALSSTSLACLVGVLIGIIAGTNPGSLRDHLLMWGAILGISVPSFFLGLLLIMIVALRLGWLPVAGTGDIKNLVLPTITLAAPTTAIVARLTRSSMISVLSMDYIRTARAKGIPWLAVVYKHALRNSLIEVITIVGLQLGYLLGGAVIIESIFAWPGIGSFLLDSILRRDFPVVQGFVLLIAFGFIMINLAVDIIYSLLDPRIRHQ